MMKFIKNLRLVIYRCIQILAFIQILAGVAWVVANFGSFQEFWESLELKEISHTLLTDEYVGILYPVLIKVTGLVSGVTKIPYYLFLYGLQIAVQFTALQMLLKEIPYRCWMVLWIMTIPAVAQINLAVLPQSLAVSMLLLCIHYCMNENWLVSAVFWLLAGLLIPEYLLFGAGLYGIWLLGRCIKENDHRKRTICMGITGILIVSLSAGIIDNLTVESYSRGRMSRTAASMALHRAVWPNFSGYQYFWNNDIKNLFTSEDLMEIDRNPYNVSTQFGYLMEKEYGAEKAESAYWYMAKESFRIGTRSVVEGITQDFILYGMSPFVLIWNLRGAGVSFCGWNYSRMSQNTPVLTRYYAYYAGNAFLILFILSMLYCLTGKRGRRFASGNLKKLLISAGILSLVMSIWYTLSATGMQDYKNAVFISVSWGLLIVCGLSGHDISEESE